MENYFKKLF